MEKEAVRQQLLLLKGNDLFPFDDTFLLDVLHSNPQRTVFETYKTDGDKKVSSTIVRVAENTESAAWQDLVHESSVSSLFRAQGMHSKISDVKLYQDDKIAFTHHQKIEGQLLEGRKGTEILNNLSPQQKKLFAEDLAVFFAEIHSIPPETVKHLPQGSQKAISYDYEKDPNFDYKQSKENLRSFGLNLDDFRVPITQDSVFCHNDLHGGNLAVDPEKNHILTGIFDLGNADINNRSADFVKICAIDRNLAHHVVTHYNKLTGQHVQMKEIDYQYLNWMMASYESLKQQNLSEETRAKVEHCYREDLTKFKLDTIKEKKEQCNSQSSTRPQTQSVSPHILNNIFDRESSR